MTNFYLDEDIEIIIESTKEIHENFNGKTILLTGGKGFLGKYFCEYFHRLNFKLKDPIKLIIYDNSVIDNSIYNFGKYSDFEFKNVDVSKKFEINEKIDYFIHSAGIASPFYYRLKPLETLDVTINGLRNILDKSLEYNSKVIYFSSSEIYGDPDVNYVPISETYRGNVSTMGPRACYDESKRLGETLCYIYNNEFNTNTNIIRPFNVYGPGMNQKDYRVLPNFANNIVNNKPLKIYGNGNQTRTYCYIADAITGFLKVIIRGKKGQAYNIGNSKPEVSVIELFDIIRKVYSSDIIFTKVPYPKSYPEDEPQRRCPNLEKAIKDLDYKPKTSIENGLEKFLKWAKINYIINE